MNSKSTRPTEQLEEKLSDPSPIPEKEPSLKDVLQAVNACKFSLKDCDQMKGVKEDLILVRQDLQKTAERTTVLEGGPISQIEDDMHPLKHDVKNMKDQISIYASKMDEMENRLRRNNVRLVGLPERSEGSDPIDFLEKLFVEVFGKESFSPLFSIERAHRVPFRAPPPGGYPRPILMKFLNYKDKVILLQKAREEGNISYKRNQSLVLLRLFV